MHPLNTESLKAISASATPPCLSLYQPTYRSHPDNKQDPIRFRHNVEALATSLRQAHPQADIETLLAPFHELANDQAFWNHTLDGLAVLGCTGTFRIFVLPRPMPELALVADSFHLNPLRRFLQSSDRYQVLCLSRDKARLFEGNRDELTEVSLAAPVPRTSTEALGDQLTEPHQTVSSHGGIGQGTSALVHSSGGKKEETDLDADRYFRALDRALIEHHSKPGGLPLILAALPEHHHRFQEVSHNPLLLPEGLEINPDALDIPSLSQAAWTIMKPLHLAHQQTWVETFANARAKGLASDDVNEVAKAAAEGRVATLLIEDERHIAGQLNLDTGAINMAEITHPSVDDVLDDIGELVERMGGEVHVLAVKTMPTQTGLAATFRH